jgi:hypothetical protein
MTAPRPAVRMPSQRGIHPNLSILVDLPSKALDAFGPTIAANHCAVLSSEFRQHPAVAGVIFGPIGVGAAELEAVADYFLEAALCCWAARQ